jgi:hypothetical protein
MILYWYYTHPSCGCQIPPCPATVAIHGKREGTISPPGPQELALSVEFLLSMRVGLAEMVRGRRGRNPSLLKAKMEIVRRHLEATTDWVALIP